MIQYPKIQTIFERDPATKNRTLLLGQFSEPAFEFLQHCVWEWTEKVDGTNIRVHWDGEHVIYMGRTDRAQIPGHLLTALQLLFPADKMREAFSRPITLFGEGYGAKIQKGGGNYRPDAGFVLFDVYCGGYWLERSNVSKIAARLAIEHVPVVGRGTIGEAVELARGGFSSTWGEFMAEGIVLRPTTELYDRRSNRIISKIKRKDFARG